MCDAAQDSCVPLSCAAVIVMRYQARPDVAASNTMYQSATYFPCEGNFVRLVSGAL